MPVIALSGLVVVSEDASSIDHERQPVLEIVSAAGKSRSEPPYHQFHKGIFCDDMALVEQQHGLHVGDNTNTGNAGQAVVRNPLGWIVGQPDIVWHDAVVGGRRILQREETGGLKEIGNWIVRRRENGNGWRHILCERGFSRIQDVPLYLEVVLPRHGFPAARPVFPAAGTRGLSILPLVTLIIAWVPHCEAGSEVRPVSGMGYSVFATGLNGPRGLVHSLSGDIFAAEQSGGTVARITPDGRVNRIAKGFSAPHDLAFDASGS